MIDSIAAIPDSPLAEALVMVDRLFTVAAIERRSIDSAKVVEYYRQTDRVYRRFHSRDGALHIGLVDCQTISPDDMGHRRHAELFGQQLDAVAARDAAEFGCGNGYNLRHLAARQPARRFVGFDLSADHVRVARHDARGAANLQFEQANYEQLACDDGSFDGVLAVETLCQTDTQSSALREALRVLRPGGRLLVIDCFRNESLERFDSDLQRAARLVEKTTAVDAFAEIEAWQALCETIGFQIREVRDRSNETARDLRRLYQLAGRFFKMPPAVRLMRHALPPLAVENAICGLLMPYTVGGGVHGYYSVVLEKPQ